MATFKPVQIKKRGESYQLNYYTPQGERRRVSAGKDYRYAQRLASKYEAWLLQDKDPQKEIERAQQREQEQSMTIREFYPIFMKRHGVLRSVGMQRNYENSFNQVCRCPSLSDKPLIDIRKSLVIDFMHSRMQSDGVKAATVNKDAAFLKCMLSKAVEWDYLEFSPLQGMRLFKEDGKRDIYLSPEQAVSLMKHLPNSVANIVEFAIYTGFRKENILSLKIEDIRMHPDDDTGEVELVIKGGRRELFPLSQLAINVIKRAKKRRNSGYVFINPTTKTRYQCIHKSFDRAVTKLKLTAGNGTKLRFHDLRHVFATWLALAGVSLDSLRILLGHQDRTTTDRYTTVSRLDVSGELKRMPDLSALEKSPENTGIGAHIQLAQN